MQYIIPSVAKFLADSVLKAAESEVNGAQKLQLIGVLTLIVMMQLREEPATSFSIAQALNISPQTLHKNVIWLVSKGIVTRTPVLNSSGRGRAYKLTLNETTEIRKLLGLEIG
jgi:DNA-binding MarR family transcriptional regulator